MTKEESELIDALCREKGEAMSPFEELTLLGFDENGRAKFLNDDNEVIEMEIKGVSENLKNIWERVNSEPAEPAPHKQSKNWNRIEEYDYDENDERYRLLTEVLRYNHNKVKYFA